MRMCVCAHMHVNVCVCNIYITHSYVEGHLGCIHLLVLTNKAAVNMAKQYLVE